jgi:DNA-binding MarR family transcriptional regulator
LNPTYFDKVAYPSAVTPGDANSFPRRSRVPREALEDSISGVISGWRAIRPDLNVEPIAITARLARLNTTLSPKLESVFERFGIRGADFAVLATLVRLGDARVSQRRLAGELGLSPGTVSVRLDRLSRRGLVQREGDPNDRRGAVLSLTRAGRELFEECAPGHLANAQAQLEGLTKRQRDQLGELLGKLLGTLEDPEPDDRLLSELGMLVDSPPVAIERRRSVGLPPIAGLLVRHVEPASPAATDGIRPGDLLTTANGRPLRSRQDLHLALIQSRDRGKMLVLEVTRGAERMRVTLSA